MSTTLRAIKSQSPPVLPKCFDADTQRANVSSQLLCSPEQNIHFFPQHYVLAFGGIIAIPLILAEPLCIKDNNVAKSQLISTIFFVSGLCTLLQTAVGVR